MKTIAITNQKGGVGKTTTAIHVAARLAALGHKTLLIDLDPQAHSSRFFMGPDTDLRQLPGVAALFAKQRQNINDITRPTKYSNLFIAPSSSRLGIEAERANSFNFRESILKNSLKAADYDYVVIDSPPYFGLLLTNAILASHQIIVPCEMAPLSLDGFADLWEKIEELKQGSPKDYVRILLTKVDKRTTTTNEAILAELKPYADLLFTSSITRSEPLNQIYFQRELVFDFQPKCSGAVDYHSLTEEISSLWPKTNS